MCFVADLVQFQHTIEQCYKNLEIWDERYRNYFQIKFSLNDDVLETVTETSLIIDKIAQFMEFTAAELSPLKRDIRFTIYFTIHFSRHFSDVTLSLKYEPTDGFSAIGKCWRLINREGNQTIRNAILSKCRHWMTNHFTKP